jgi:hypothetical protein
MQIGAFVGDFIFTFVKDPLAESPQTESGSSLNKLKESLVSVTALEKRTESGLREEAYNLLIPFLADHARGDAEACEEAAEFFEFRMRELEPHFRKQRAALTARRKREFAKLHRA